MAKPKKASARVLAMKRRVLSEAQVSGPDLREVVIYFKEPQAKVPWWRRSKTGEHARVFQGATVELVPTPTATLVRLTRGPMTEHLDWNDIRRIIALPIMDLPSAEPDEEKLDEEKPEVEA